MTGEMSWIKPNGDAADGNSYPLHAQVARKLRCTLRPFDTYVGPYIKTKRGKLFLSSEDGCIGTACLWPGGVAPAYCEPITAEYAPLYDVDAATDAARRTLKQWRKLQQGPPGSHGNVGALRTHTRRRTV